MHGGFSPPRQATSLARCRTISPQFEGAFGEQFLDVTVREAVAHRYTITSAGKRNPANAERVRDER
jgi:hypothetical protein